MFLQTTGDEKKKIVEWNQRASTPKLFGRRNVLKLKVVLNCSLKP